MTVLVTAVHSRFRAGEYSEVRLICRLNLTLCRGAELTSPGVSSGRFWTQRGPEPRTGGLAEADGPLGLRVGVGRRDPAADRPGAVEPLLVRVPTQLYSRFRGILSCGNRSGSFPELLFWERCA